MKKISKLLLGVLSGMLILTGCNNEVSKVNSDEIYTVGISQFGEHASLDNCREGFIQGLADEGFIEGENLKIIYENAQFDTGISNQISNGFISKKVDLIAAVATPVAQSAYNAARDTDIPVVFTAVTDPEAAMLTTGNITGTSDKLPIKAQLELIRTLMPEAKNIGILYTTSEVNSESAIKEYKEYAKEYNFTIVDIGVSVSADIPLAVDKMLEKVDCISNLTDNTVVGSLPMILNKAKNKNIPVFGSEIEQVKIGCIASEGLEYVGLGVQTGKIAAKILKGEKTAEEIPYETIEESMLYINSEVMEEFDIELPKSLEDRAINVLE